MLVGLAILALKILPAGKILGWANRPARRIDRFADPDLPTFVGAAVVQALPRFALQAPCLPAALAALQMLRRRGVAGILRLGVQRDGASLLAHAWAEVDGKAVVGQTENAFAPLASFGPGRAGEAS
jgi:Transglutaminase-like superfamily